MKAPAITYKRHWSMPNKATFAMPPVDALLSRVCDGEVVDPFARSSRWGSIRNDINPAFDTDFHMDAREFLQMLIADNVRADVLLLDPPYSPTQITREYQEAGLKATMTDTQNATLMREVKDLGARLVVLGGVVVCFAWNSSGMGIKRGFDLIEVHMISHGGAHNDTIVTVEKKTHECGELF